MKDEVEVMGQVVEPEQGEFTPGRRLYLDKDGKVVEANDPTKLTKLCSETGCIPMARARELGLLNKAEVEPEQIDTKAVESAPANKAVAMPKAKVTKKAK